ncbi:adenine nucleotide alpha hydrolases-like protein [Xylariaceae sp. FL1272]|nr:adenine nucleotide alpha hydrolases-like protein [Xylariaceae sp. FL1272]
MAGADHRLSVIALVSGGKDSFYSILHCLAHDHRVVALANLYPAEESQHGSSSSLDSGEGNPAGGNDTDLNSFMYQTVGHQVIPLYAQATGLPLYRQPIVGTAVDQGLSYRNPRLASAASLGLGPQADHLSTLASPVVDSVHRRELSLRDADEQLQEPEEDETESLVPLLRTILEAHPEANALCTGAILSTYQRTRVESVALRLGLTPLSFLWQYTELPRPLGQYATTKPGGINRDDAQLLRDMAVAGLEARIVKVASAGLDEGFLWENVSSEAGVHRVEHAMRRFGGAGGRGSILGEGGEFETLVIDGPSILFKGRVVISEDDKHIVREGGGCAWLRFVKANVEMKMESGQTAKNQLHDLKIRIPEVFDARFERVMQSLARSTSLSNHPQKLGFGYPLTFYAKPPISIDFAPRWKGTSQSALSEFRLPQPSTQEWRFLGGSGDISSGVEQQAIGIVHDIRRRLDAEALQTTAITNSLIVLRHMSDFPRVNEHYGSLFPHPNPPSRVTISCGEELLPQHAAIAVYLTIQPHLQSSEIRGLHVQSRSYWAPANIGPYSQAISFPVLSSSSTALGDGQSGVIYGEDDHDVQQPFETIPLGVCIAGQIPLIPASMTLPPHSESNDELQITLALQHLWRIATEMQVRWWTSAVAYFPATQSPDLMQRRALLAAIAWKAAHIWPQDDTNSSDACHAESDMSEDEEDIWDRRYNFQSMAYHGGVEEKPFPLPLPDWSVLKGYTEEDVTSSNVEAKVGCIPFMFAAEVEELPRQASVEWQAHLGLAELRSESVVAHRSRHKISVLEALHLDLEVHHTIVDSNRGIFIQTIACLLYPDAHENGEKVRINPEVLFKISAAVDLSCEDLGLPPMNSSEPKITYTDSLELQANNDEQATLGAHIPCHSLWDSQGRRLGVVCIFETRLNIMKE